MKKNLPHIVCHMMASLDGRIDCAMTSKLPGVTEYYEALRELDLPSTVSGRTTAKLELTGAPDFSGDAGPSVSRETYYCAQSAGGYSIVTDTRGTLGWDGNVVDGKPLLVVMSEQAGENYLAYLKNAGISYIVCGKKRTDLRRASGILHEAFHVDRMGIVGGGTINAAFLDAGLLDEISMLYAPGIDGRMGRTAAFDGLPQTREPYKLKLKSVQSYGDGAVWLRYIVD